MSSDADGSAVAPGRTDAKLERFFSSALSLLAIADHEFRFRHLNPAWEELLGYEVEDLLGRRYLDFVHPDDVEATIAEADSIRGGRGAVRDFENRYLARDGGVRWLRWNAVAGDGDGLVYAVATDVTELKEVERRARAAQHELERGEELAGLGSWSWRPETNELRWSRGLHALTGVPPERFEPTLEFSLSLVHPDDRAAVESAVRSMQDGDRTVRGRYRIVRADGEVRVIDSLSDVEVDEDERVQLVFATCQDVTSRRHARLYERRAEELERAAFRDAPLGIDLVSIAPDSLGRILQVNRAFAEILGRSQEELVGTDISSLTHPDDRDLTHAQFDALRQGHPASSIEKRYLLPSGDPVWVHSHASLFRLSGTERAVALGHVQNIDARKRAEGFLEMKLRVARVVAGARRLAEALPSLLAEVGDSLGWCAGTVLEVSDDGTIAVAEEIWASSRAAKEGGFLDSVRNNPVATTEGVLAEAVRHGGCIGADVADDRVLGPLAEGTGVQSAAVVPLTIDGRVAAALLYVDTGPIRLDEVGREALHGISNEVESLVARERAEAELAYQALHDPLTGLANRTLLLDRVEQALLRRGRAGAGLGLLFLDVDDFKRVNDTLGHPAGDEVLRALAQRFEAAVRPGDTVARFGGDEFVVLAEGIDDPDRLGEFAGRVMGSLDPPFGLEEDVFLRASMGAACVSPSERIDTRELIRRADAAMYKAKQRGRGRWELAERLAVDRSRGQLDLERALRRALERGDLELAYQPIVSLDDERIRHVEALLRWTDPELGPVGPSTFVPVAEQSALILTVGELVIHQATRQMADWLATNALPDLCRVSVNLSGRQLAQPELPDIVASALEGCGLVGESLALEITETALINLELASEALGRLHDLGAQIVVDDFGTGYASLSSLRHFPLDVLKVDQSFVGEMVHKTGECKIVEAMIELGRALDLEVVAEGIETGEQLRLLRKLGCTLGQGFLLGRPVPAEELPRVAAALPNVVRRELEVEPAL